MARKPKTCTRERGQEVPRARASHAGSPFSGSPLCPFPVLAVAAREPGDSSDLATCPHAATEVMPWPQSGRSWVAARPLGTTPHLFSKQLRAPTLYPRLIRQKKEEQYILFGVLNIQCSNGSWLGSIICPSSTKAFCSAWLPSCPGARSGGPIPGIKFTHV